MSDKPVISPATCNNWPEDSAEWTFDMVLEECDWALKHGLMLHPCFYRRLIAEVRRLREENKALQRRKAALQAEVRDWKHRVPYW